ncbi:cytochrome P450 [Streptomyces sp. NBC_01506]|uniref:cytochrome P450 n=1 Tax=Streptomyces sp. NBC_01506 TaxID=2903887 RepID=UPI003863F0D3
MERDVRRQIAFAFGFGVHQCLGRPLARLELEVVYSTLYRRVPTLCLPAPMDQLPFKNDGNDGIAYGMHELPVTW